VSEQEEVSRDRGFAVSVIVITPDGIPLVKEKELNRIPFFKFPGGKRDGRETPVACAVRELQEETGLVLNPSDLVLLLEQNRRTHDYYLFGARSPSLNGLKKVGDEGEYVGVFSLQDLLVRQGDIFPNHWTFEARKFIYGVPYPTEVCSS